MSDQAKPAVDVDELLDECLAVIRTEVRRMKVTQDANKKLDAIQVNAIAKFAGTLQGIAMVRLNPFGDYQRMKRVAEDAQAVVMGKQKLLDDGRGGRW